MYLPQHFQLTGAEPSASDRRAVDERLGKAAATLARYGHYLAVRARPLAVPRTSARLTPEGFRKNPSCDSPHVQRGCPEW
jgi:hypothetical protein